MGLFNIWKKKEDKNITIPHERSVVGVEYRDDISKYLGLFSPATINNNFIEAFETIGEVYFPIKFLADRISSANFVLKSEKDDSIIWNNKEINNFLSNPNPLFSFDEIVKLFFVYKYVTGNAYFQAALPASQTKVNEIWKWCDSYWVLPSQKINIVVPQIVPLFTPAKIGDLIKSYRLNTQNGIMNFLPENILHEKDINLRMDNSFFKGGSRLSTQKYPIANLAAVYEARNVIYIKRGALGLLISKKYDATGSLPLEDAEKKRIRDEWNKSYGLSSDKSTINIVDIDAEFVKMNMSIQELQPFEETLADACQIAGVFSIPSVLIPRKDMAKYDNQDIAEISVYSNVIIPEAVKFSKSLTRFLGLDKSGMYIDADFSHIDVLQKKYLERSSTKKIISEKCRQEFFSGIITLNDWRAQIGESMVVDPIYNKLILHMTDEELKRIDIISKGQSQESKIINSNIK